MFEDRKLIEAETVYLISVRDPLVCQDLHDTICDCDPRARVVICSSVAALKVGLEAHDAVRLVFVEASHADLVAQGLDTSVHKRGGAMILLGGAAEGENGVAQDEGERRYGVLVRPFTTRDILRQMRAATGGL